MQQDNSLQNNKYLIILSMLFITIMLTCAVLIYKPVKMWFGYASGATLVFPIWFVLSDIIAEVYGFTISRKILYSAIICQLIFSTICFIMLRTPVPDNWQYQSAFELVIGHLFRITLSTAVTLFISVYVNMYLVTKWKILLRGRYFWIRSLGASIIGEGIYSAIAVLLMQYKMVPLSNIPLIIFWAYASKIISTVVLAVPGNLVCSYIKKTEVMTIIEKNINPLKNATFH